MEKELRYFWRRHWLYQSVRDESLEGGENDLPGRGAGSIIYRA